MFRVQPIDDDDHGERFLLAMAPAKYPFFSGPPGNKASSDHSELFNLQCHVSVTLLDLSQGDTITNSSCQSTCLAWQKNEMLVCRSCTSEVPDAFVPDFCMQLLGDIWVVARWLWSSVLAMPWSQFVRTMDEPYSSRS